MFCAWAGMARYFIDRKMDKTYFALQIVHTKNYESVDGYIFLYLPSVLGTWMPWTPDSQIFRGFEKIAEDPPSGWTHDPQNILFSHVLWEIFHG